MIFSDGVLINYNEAGLHIGIQDFSLQDPYWIPAIMKDDELRYTILKTKDFTIDERTQLLESLKRFYDYYGELEKDIVSQVKGEEVKELRLLKRLTHSSIIAYIFGKEDYWLWDADRVYHELGEKPLPGTITEFVIEQG